MSGSHGPPGYGEPPSHVHPHQSGRLYYHTYYPNNDSHDTMSGPQTPTPARPQGSTGAKQNALALVLPKWPEFVKKSKEGILGAESEKSVSIFQTRRSSHACADSRQIRSVITQQCKGAIYHGYILHKMNIFDNMHPALDPRVGHNGTGPQLSRERYEAERLGALEELKTLQLKKKAAAAVGTGTPTGSPMVASSSAIPNQASSPASMSAPTPPAMAQAASSPNPSGAGSPRPLNPVNSQAGARPPVRPTGLVPPEGIIALDEMRKILGIADINARYAFLEKVSDITCRMGATDNLRLQVFEQNLKPRSNSIKPERRNLLSQTKATQVDHLVDPTSDRRITALRHQVGLPPPPPVRRHHNTPSPISRAYVQHLHLHQHPAPLLRDKPVRPIQQVNRVKLLIHTLACQTQTPMRQTRIRQTLFLIDHSI